MRYLEIHCEGFRNLATCTLELHPEVNWIYGANGQGKTNFFECLTFLVSGRSHRRCRDEELLAFGAEHFFISGSLQDDGGGRMELSASFARGGPKRMRLDRQDVEKLADLVSLTGTVLFGPGDVDLVTGEPQNRRRYIDYTLSKTDPAYLRDLIAYRRVLGQRNALLRGGRDSRQLRIWTERLGEIGGRIVFRRRQEIDLLNEHCSAFYREIGGEDEELSLRYKTRIAGESEDALAGDLQARLERLESSEWLKKRTLEGPHRDDIGIDISLRDARKFASQGQKRSAAVALKLAQAEYLAQTRRDRPIVFLDDVFSELDRSRRERLCRLVGRKYQTFLASPHVEDLRRDLFGEMQLLRIEAGRILPGQEA